MTVRYRARALKDLDGIYEWRAQQSPALANRIEAAIFSATDWLGERPEVGSKTDEPNVRRWPMIDFKYTIFYLVEEDAINVLRIMDAGRVRDLKRVPID